MRRFPIVFAIIPLVMSSQSGALTLWQLWHQATQRDPQFQVYRKRLAARSQAEPTALAVLLPQLSVNAGLALAQNQSASPQLSGNGLSTYTYSEQTRYRVLSWNAVLSQSLFNWTALQDYRVSQYQVLAAADQYQSSVQTLATTVVSDYINWLKARANLQTLIAAEQGFARQAYAAQARYRAGTTGIIGAEESRVALDQVRAQVFQARSRWDTANAALEALTGEPPPREVPSLPHRIRLPQHDTRTQWMEIARRHNPVVAAYRALHHAASRQVSAALGGFLPTLTLQLEHSQEAQSGQAQYAVAGEAFSGPNAYQDRGNSLNLELTWNLFSGGSQQVALATARYRQETAFAQIMTAERSVQQEITRNYQAMGWDLRQVRLYRRSLEVAQRAVKASTDGVRVGLISENNAIANRQSDISVQSNLNAAISDAIIHYVQLCTNAGIVTPELIRRLSLTLSTAPGVSGP